jgi:hypothetical protein
VGIQATFVFADKPQELNTSLFRCAIPAKYLRKAENDIELVHFYETDLKKFSDTILVERLIFPEAIKIWRRIGVKKIIGTFDDAYHLMPDSCGSAKSFWNDENLRLFRAGLALCDKVVVPSQRLADDFRTCGNLSVLKNYHDDELWPIVPKEEKEVITIGWGGSDGHLESWKKSSFPPAMAILKKKYGKKINFLMVGKVSTSIVDQDVPCSFIPRWVPFNQWPEVVRSFDIGIAPLSGAYDMRRSNLKIVEYGLAGIPFACSNKGEYARTFSVSSGDSFPNTYLCDKTEEWVDYLSELIDKGFEYRQEMGALNRKWAESYLMSKHVQEYLDVLSN